MNRDLFLAILAMDSYNRGYGQGIRGLLVDANVTRLGDALIKTDSVIRIGVDAESAGFYAIAYELPAGYIEDLSGTVISYRGTDNISIFGSGDIVNGWFIGGGAQGDWAGAQTRLPLPAA